MKISYVGGDHLEERQILTNITHTQLERDIYLLGWNHPLRAGLGYFMSSRDLLIDRNLENLGQLVTRAPGHHTTIRLQLKEMVLINNSQLTR